MYLVWEPYPYTFNKNRWLISFFEKHWNSPGNCRLTIAYAEFREIRVCCAELVSLYRAIKHTMLSLFNTIVSYKCAYFVESLEASTRICRYNICNCVSKSKYTTKSIVLYIGCTDVWLFVLFSVDTLIFQDAPFAYTWY